MFTYRLITPEELDLVRAMFDYDPSLVDVDLTPAQIDEWCVNTMKGIGAGSRACVMAFDENKEPVAMTIGSEYTQTKAWYKGISKIRKPNNYYPTTARIMGPAEDMLIQYMEDRGNFKYWSATFEGKYHTTRNNILRKHSPMFARYDGFDELIVPPGQETGLKIWDLNRRPHPFADILIRMYVLRQEYRVPLVKEQREKLNIKTKSH
ncbi:hypothetical protein UFOVP71_150 [uncultured Caudovirales phage]|uniref:Uncharacterized protein n=1 Tax=uncultured Caudovirales phage TaxID=2100421 RepID=A0A6J5T9V4_9CAUD|nr:hypothetical protein UFOVP71_150 [uncultured Caudovirales phage]